MAFDDQTESGLYVPGDFYNPNNSGSGVLIDNRTDLPDDTVRYAVATYFDENVASFGHQNSFQTYSNGGNGSFLARTKFEAPANVFDEIRMARDLAWRDDDIRSTIGAMVAIAYKDGMENFSSDEETQILFNKICRNGKFDDLFKRMYLEYLIAQSVTTVSLYTRESYDFTHSGVTRTISRNVASPLVGILPAEQIRVLGDDMFGNAPLAYVPESQKIREWLEKYFGKSTTAAARAQMAREQPVWAALFVEKVEVTNNVNLIGATVPGYRLNPRMVSRLKAPCNGPYPRPLLLANFALLEAKRLLNLLDWSFLQGGVNFLVIAKKGSDQLPAQPEEVANLREVLRASSRSGVVVGDHRLSIEIVTPNLTEMLNAEKRKMLGRQLSMTMLRLPAGAIEEGSGGEGEKAVVEVISAVITSDRNDIKRHIEGEIYEDVVNRNQKVFPEGAAKIWHPKIVLQGLNFFTDLVLKLNDRGAIPRKYAVEAGGFDYDAAVSEKMRETEQGHDQIMAPPQIPFSSPNVGPQDNNSGRPTGGNGPDPAKPQLTLVKNPGETIKAEYDEELEQVVRYGELTAAILDEFPEHTIGRMTKVEQEGLDADCSFQKGPTIVIPVNTGYETKDHRIVRLRESVSMIVGVTGRGAIVARALCFRDEAYSIADAENRTIAWGFEIKLNEETQVVTA